MSRNKAYSSDLIKRIMRNNRKPIDIDAIGFIDVVLVVAFLVFVAALLIK